MQRNYWDSLAPSFDNEVFDPVAEDRRQTLASTIRSLARQYPDMVDIGCGNGRNMLRFSKYFHTIQGIDISNSCIQEARTRLADSKKIALACHDLARPWPSASRFSLGLCLNVCLETAYERRMNLLANCLDLVRKGGRMLLVVPAVESVLLTAHRQVLLNKQIFNSYRQAAAASTAELGFSACSLRDGIICKGNTATKHYLKEELEMLVAHLGHRIHEIKKVEYEWSSEFEEPPSKMAAPYPWDWLVISSPA